MKYKVGDKVRVRQWDDMRREFGEDSDYDIRTPNYCFTLGMKKFCGELVTITDTPYSDCYLVAEDGDRFYWNDCMFEDIKKETKEMGKVHPKDEDHLKRVENIKKKIEYYKEKSGFNKIEEVVPGKVLNIEIATEDGYSTYKTKTVCDSRDNFSIEGGLYIALARRNYSDKFTPEGVEKMAEMMKLEKVYVKRVNAAMKMLAAQEELEEENAKYKLALEARKKSRWNRKKRQLYRRVERERIQEEKEREEKIQIQTEAILRAKEIAKQKKKDKKQKNK